MSAFLTDFPGIIPFKYSNPELSLVVSFIKKAVALLGINVLPPGSVSCLRRLLARSTQRGKLSDCSQKSPKNYLFILELVVADCL